MTGEALMIAFANHGLKISRQTISSWENGETTPTVKQLAVYAEFFKKPISFFFKQEHTLTG